MDILTQLAWLDDAIAKKSEKTAEMRNIVASIREQIEAYQQLAVEHEKLKAAQPENHPNPPNWGSQPRINGRTEQ
jgi:hypothetical protein